MTTSPLPEVWDEGGTVLLAVGHLGGKVKECNKGGVSIDAVEGRTMDRPPKKKKKERNFV